MNKSESSVKHVLKLVSFELRCKSSKKLANLYVKEKTHRCDIHGKTVCVLLDVYCIYILLFKYMYMCVWKMLLLIH